MAVQRHCNFVRVHQGVREKLGCYRAAYLYAYLEFLNASFKGNPFYRTLEQITVDTGMNRTDIENARKILESGESPAISTVRKESNRVYFTLNWPESDFNL